jgi:hypothetical protein
VRKTRLNKLTALKKFEVGRDTTDETSRASKKAAVPTSAKDPTGCRGEVETRKFFAPFRSTHIDIDASGTESIPTQGTVPEISARPPEIVLTSLVNLIQLQKVLKAWPQFQISKPEEWDWGP